MQAAYYRRKGPAAEVLQLGELETPQPAQGEVRVRIRVSAVNPSDTKNRGGHRGNIHMPFPLIIPHQDGSGIIEAVGEGVQGLQPSGPALAARALLVGVEARRVYARRRTPLAPGPDAHKASLHALGIKREVLAPHVCDLEASQGVIAEYCARALLRPVRRT